MKKRVYSRAQAEDEFVHALTRQVGYTAGAFSVRRMANIVSLFEDVNAYQFELIKRLPAVYPGGELGEKYAADVLNFASELGIISKLQGAAASHLSRYVLSNAGFAIRTARAVDEHLEQLVLEHLILENDSDAYLRVLWLLANGSNKSSDELSVSFRDLVLATREARFSWLQSAFPSKPVFMRFIKGGAAHSQIHWLKTSRFGVGIEPIGADFGRHHFAARKSWASELGHYDAGTRAITDNGRKFLELAGWSTEKVAEHWIGPPDECLAFLRVPQGRRLLGAHAPTIDLLRPHTNECEPTPELVEMTACFLRDAFDHIRLVHARQALTSPVVYFLIKQERLAGRRYDLEAVLREVARTRGSEFAFFSSRSGSLAYYQIRKTNHGKH